MIYNLKLPIPPSINNYYFKGRVLKKSGREYRKYVVSLLSDYDFETLDSRLSMTVFFSFPSNHRRDLDNYLKCLQDSLTHSNIYSDDSLIDSLLVFRRPVIKDNGSLIVSISDTPEKPCLSLPILQSKVKDFFMEIEN